MAWNLIRADAGTRLNRIRNWEARGLPYWQSRVLTCHSRVLNADSASQLDRALNDREVAELAVRRLTRETSQCHAR
jgi:hypothetical protein